MKTIVLIFALTFSVTVAATVYAVYTTEIADAAVANAAATRHAALEDRTCKFGCWAAVAAAPVAVAEAVQESAPTTRLASIEDRTCKLGCWG